jgi:hypothetical protein
VVFGVTFMIIGLAAPSFMNNSFDTTSLKSKTHY